MHCIASHCIALRCGITCSHWLRCCLRTWIIKVPERVELMFISAEREINGVSQTFNNSSCCHLVGVSAISVTARLVASVPLVAGVPLLPLFLLLCFNCCLCFPCLCSPCWPCFPACFVSAVSLIASVFLFIVAPLFCSIGALVLYQGFGHGCCGVATSTVVILLVTSFALSVSLTLFIVINISYCQ